MEGGQAIPVGFGRFLDVLKRGILIPRRVELYPKSSTKFHVAFDGKILFVIHGNTVDFQSKGDVFSEIGIGANDAVRIWEFSGPNTVVSMFRIELVNGLTLTVA